MGSLTTFYFRNALLFASCLIALIKKEIICLDLFAPRLLIFFYLFIRNAVRITSLLLLDFLIGGLFARVNGVGAHFVSVGFLSLIDESII